MECQVKTLPAMKIAAVRMQAPYKDCGQGFKLLFKSFFWQKCGPPMLLCYDTQYQEIANYEVCLPIKKGESCDKIAVKDLPSGRCVSLLHQGPYEELCHSYDKARTYAAANGFQLSIPSCEIYLKGPGMIFRGNPKNYLTEIQLMIEG